MLLAVPIFDILEFIVFMTCTQAGGMTVPIFDIFALIVTMTCTQTEGTLVYACAQNLIYHVVLWCSIFGDAGEPMVSQTDIIKYIIP